MSSARNKAKRRSKKVTLDDVWATIDSLAKEHKETEKALQEIQAAMKETQAAVKETQAAVKETQIALQETQKVMQETRKETERVMQETRKETERVMQETRKETQKVLQKTRKETERVMQETRKETQKVLQETRKETERVIQETRKETQKVLQETQKIVGDLGNRLGDMAECTLTPNLPEKFRQYNFTFSRISQNMKLKDKENGIYAEIDAMLENGTQAMAVEVKVNLKTADIDDHIRRMEKIRRYADLHGDKRQFYGAVAATVVSEEVELYAVRHGFYLIKPSGEDVAIVPPVSREKFW